MSASRQTAATFLKPLTMECGTEAVVGYPIAKETAAMLEIPYEN